MAGRTTSLGVAFGVALAASAAGQDEAWRSVTHSSNAFGWDTAVLSDLDGDGWREVLIAVPDESAYVMNGYVLGLDGRTGAILFRIDGNETSYGFYVAPLGSDADGDGVEDFLVMGDSWNLGEVVLYSGADQTEIRRGADFGSLESVPDVDGDGIRDFVVGWVTNARVYSSATFAKIYTFPGCYSSEYNDSVAVVGDLDGDGFSELAVGDAAAYNGRGTVHFWSLKDGTKLGELKGGPQGDAFGYTVIPLGDLDGDGVGDFAVGSDFDSNQADHGQVSTYSGRTRTLLHELRHERGERPVSLVGEAGDVDGDGCDDYLAHFQVDDPVFRYDRGTTWVVSGRSGKPFVNLSSLDLAEAGITDPDCVTGADVDGDGFSDLVVTKREYLGRSTAILMRGGLRFLSAWHERVTEDQSGGHGPLVGGPPPPPPGADGRLYDSFTWLVAAGFAPVTPFTLVLVAFDGVAMNLPVVQSLTDADGRWTGHYPALLEPDHEWELQAVGLDGGGNVVTTPIERIAYRYR